LDEERLKPVGDFPGLGSDMVAMRVEMVEWLGVTQRVARVRLQQLRLVEMDCIWIVYCAYALCSVSSSKRHTAG